MENEDGGQNAPASRRVFLAYFTGLRVRAGKTNARREEVAVVGRVRQKRPGKGGRALALGRCLIGQLRRETTTAFTMPF